ncbi:peptidase associated/transthyretin-like domain-containing protein [Legionella fallonii]|uniref:Carboxypeptidase regulatory-like domain-containing protein n=1 Tax=Legionella fallonii LLAP-10 TaxID=1212491 RepID=A0A098G9H3_9GAMM|nr:hypothetical protein [Legionella fallonii]CEG58120.1 conserved protein of unknown function [Legionella fallonii LLAP-10]
MKKETEKKETALVSGVAHSYATGWPINGATITVIEDETIKLTTDSAGKFGPFEYPIGQPITLVFEKTGSLWSGYKTTQTSTMIVTSEGFNNKDYLKNITFQVPSNIVYKFLFLAMGVTENPELCQIATTVTALNKTIEDIPQGIAGVTVEITPKIDKNPFYFGTVPILDITNPFVRTLSATTMDGGVAFLNVPEGKYVLEARKEGMTFSQVEIQARKGVLVNASPQRGLTQQQEFKPNSYVFFQPADATENICISDEYQGTFALDRNH